MRLCGFTSRFQLLSPCVRQVTHALLTRPPLSHINLHTEIFRSICFVRLACVKHAASVHPEPGSNSHKKFLLLYKLLISSQHKLANSIRSPPCFQDDVLFFKVTFPSAYFKAYFHVRSFLKFFKNFQGCFTVQLSRFCLFPNFYYQVCKQFILSFRCLSCRQL